MKKTTKTFSHPLQECTNLHAKLFPTRCFTTRIAAFLQTRLAFKGYTYSLTTRIHRYRPPKWTVERRALENPKIQKKRKKNFDATPIQTSRTTEWQKRQEALSRLAEKTRRTIGRAWMHTDTRPSIGFVPTPCAPLINRPRIARNHQTHSNETIRESVNCYPPGKVSYRLSGDGWISSLPKLWNNAKRNVTKLPFCSVPSRPVKGGLYGKMLSKYPPVKPLDKAASSSQVQVSSIRTTDARPGSCKQGEPMTPPPCWPYPQD